MLIASATCFLNVLKEDTDRAVLVFISLPIVVAVWAARPSAAAIADPPLVPTDATE